MNGVFPVGTLAGFGAAEWMRGTAASLPIWFEQLWRSLLHSKQRRSIVLDLIEKPCAKLLDFRRVECRFAANDPIGEFGRHGLVQGTNETAGDQIERRQCSSRQRDTLTGNSGIDGKRGLIENRPV